MDIFAVISLFGGLALFLYGMNEMGAGLEKLSGGRLEKTLEKFTNGKLRAVLLGALVTAVIQSSSATTVMVVGFVNSGIMQLSQAVGVIMGANIGTTVTSWILSLSGIEGDSVFIKLMKPENFSPVLAVIGIIFAMFSKQGKKRDVGNIMVAFAILMFGMSTMSNAVKPLASSESFKQLFVMFSNPILGVLVGALLTAVIQSSSASVGILQAFARTGAITYASAIPIILGQNIGTCVTALISCIGANKNAKRAAMVHFYFNIIGTIIFMAVFYSINAAIHLPFVEQYIPVEGIAIVHTAFNILSTAVLLPFSKVLVKLATLTIKDNSQPEEKVFIDERFLNTPSFAIDQCKSMTKKMASLSQSTFTDSIGLLFSFDAKKAEEITKNENKIDVYEDKLGSFLVKLSGKELSDRDSRKVSKILHSIGDFERIGDHAVNLLDVAKEIDTKKVKFSDEAMHELSVIIDALAEILKITITAYNTNDVELAKKVEPLEQVIDGLKTELKNRHIDRLQNGKCTIEQGFIFSDILNNFERTSDHCSNIAVCLIQTNESTFETHGYLNQLKNSSGTPFSEEFDEYKLKYSL